VCVLHVALYSPQSIPAGASRTALHLAAAHGHAALVSRLVTKYAASPIIKDKYGSTPIEDAIRHKHMAVVEFLATQPIASDINSDAYVEQCASQAHCTEMNCASCLLLWCLHTPGDGSAIHGIAPVIQLVQ
jgi:uncharacterized protein (DUF1330 family)